MTTPYPVDIEVHSPDRFDRVHLLVRFAILLATGILGISLGWLVGALYLVLPALVAGLVAARGSERAMAEVSPPLQKVIAWVVGFYAYMTLVTDALPLDGDHSPVRLKIQPSGQPTVASALLRWLTSFPSVFVLGILAFVSGVLALLGALSVLGTFTQPPGLLRYQRGVLAWQARLLAYHGSLVEEYPPFHLDFGADTEAHAT